MQPSRRILGLECNVNGWEGRASIAELTDDQRSLGNVSGQRQPHAPKTDGGWYSSLQSWLLVEDVLE